MHHPPIAAVHADSPHWDYWVYSYLCNYTHIRVSKMLKQSLQGHRSMLITSECGI